MFIVLFRHEYSKRDLFLGQNAVKSKIVGKETEDLWPKVTRLHVQVALG